jgi:hypothetical protein
LGPTSQHCPIAGVTGGFPVGPPSTAGCSAASMLASASLWKSSF